MTYYVIRWRNTLGGGAEIYKFKTLEYAENKLSMLKFSPGTSSAILTRDDDPKENTARGGIPTCPTCMWWGRGTAPVNPLSRRQCRGGTPQFSPYSSSHQSAGQWPMTKSSDHCGQHITEKQYVARNRV
jgi:hypothetical protein